jgi:hypothetical protein
LWTKVMAFGRTRSASRGEPIEIEPRAELDRELGPVGADAVHDLAHQHAELDRRRSRSTRSPGSITDNAPASSAVRPDPGMQQHLVARLEHLAQRQVVGSRTSSSKLRSYWIVGG